MSFQTVEAKIKGALPQLMGLNATVRFDMGDDGILFLDGNSMPVSISTDTEKEADCTIKITSDNLVKLIDGQLNPMLAFTMGKLKVAGSTGIAMKLSSMLED